MGFIKDIIKRYTYKYEYSKRKLGDLLPIGSIICIKNDTKKYMILNYSGNWIESKEKSKTFVEVDYRIVEYPMIYFLINFAEEKGIVHEDITDVIFLGYDSSERKQFSQEFDKLCEVKNENK